MKAQSAQVKLNFGMVLTLCILVVIVCVLWVFGGYSKFFSR